MVDEWLRDNQRSLTTMLLTGDHDFDDVDDAISDIQAEHERARAQALREFEAFIRECRL
jgi:hypothetical protein